MHSDREELATWILDHHYYNLPWNLISIGSKWTEQQIIEMQFDLIACGCLEVIDEVKVAYKYTPSI